MARFIKLTNPIYWTEVDQSDKGTTPEIILNDNTIESVAYTKISKEDYYNVKRVLSGENASVIKEESDIFDEDIVDGSPSESIESIKEYERNIIKKALEKHCGNRKGAAAQLGICERTLYRKMKEYNL